MSKCVIVDVDLNLAEEIPPVVLNEGDWVEWKFANLPIGCIPYIQFPTALGPFQCLQMIAPVFVQGKGNVGPAASNDYTYQVLVLDETGVSPDRKPIRGSLRNLSAQRNTSPEVTVDLSGKTPDVQPARLAISPGDTAIWHVRGLPPQHSVTFRFNHVIPGSNSFSVLFESILTSRALETDGNDLRIYGIRFAAPDALESYTYGIDVRDPSGEVVASGDPVIDNLGQPGPPGGGHKAPRGKGGCLGVLARLFGLSSG